MLKAETTKLGQGAVEIAVRFAETRELVAVITHPCAGAKWFVHSAHSASPRGEGFRTRALALSRAAELASAT